MWLTSGFLLTAGALPHSYQRWPKRRCCADTQTQITNTFIRARCFQHSQITSSSRIPPWIQWHCINHQGCLHRAVPAGISQSTGIKHFTVSQGEFITESPWNHIRRRMTGWRCLRLKADDGLCLCLSVTSQLASLLRLGTEMKFSFWVEKERRKTTNIRRLCSPFDLHLYSKVVISCRLSLLKPICKCWPFLKATYVPTFSPSWALEKQRIHKRSVITSFH